MISLAFHLKRCATLLLVLLGGWLSGCSTVPAPDDQTLARLLEWQSPDDSVVSLPTEDELFRLTPEMEVFAEDNITAGSRYGRLRQLTQALISPDALAVTYDPTANGTAAQVFQQGRGNCLSFAILFMAFANYLDLDAYANEVRIPQTWDVHGRNTLVTYRHVNVIASGSARRQWVVDLNQGLYSPYYPQSKIDSKQLLANLYNNIGVERMLAKQYGAAYQAYTASIEQNPRDEDTWSNLGNLMRREGEKELALAAYGQALRFSPSNVSILSNLYELYRQQGDDLMVETLSQRVESARQRNPYYHYWRALNHYQDSRWADSLEALARAIALEDQDHRFHFLRAVLLRKLNQVELSDQAIKQAQTLAPPKKAGHYPLWLKHILGQSV